jgi:TolA-binding protein
VNIKEDDSMSNELAEEHYNKGLQYFNDGKWDQAMESLKESISENPQYIESYNLLGQVYVKKGKPDVAKRCWLLALRFDPDNALAKQFLAELDIKPSKKSKSFAIKDLVWPIIVVILLAALITTNLILLDYINGLKFDLSAARIAREDIKAELVRIAALKGVKPRISLQSQNKASEKSEVIKRKPSEEDLQDYPTKPIFTKPVQTETKFETESQVTEAYQRAFKECQSGQYDIAIKGFQQILNYPGDNDVKDNSQYWLAECYYAQKNYSKALTEFQKIKQNFPKSDKVFDAELKVSLTYLKMGSKEEARNKLIQVSKEWPDQKYKSKILELSRRIQEGQ